MSRTPRVGVIENGTQTGKSGTEKGTTDQEKGHLLIHISLPSDNDE
jgi:hypothetical protein